MTFSARTALPLLALALLLAAQSWVNALWIGTDQGLGEGVCCSFTAPVFDILKADGTDQLGWPWSTYRRSMGLLVWPALAARKVVGANPDFLLWLNFAVVLLTSLLLYDVGTRMSNRWGGVISAAIFPMVPAVAFMARRWDAMVHQHLLLAAGAAVALRSNGFRNWGWTAAFGIVAAIGSVLSARETDNLLFMAAIGAMAVGVGLQGLVGGKLLRSVAGTVGLAGAMAVFMDAYAFPLVDFAYFQDEMGNREYVEGARRLSMEAITAYPLRMYSDDFTPWLIGPFLVALVPFLRRGSGRMMTVMWLLLPLAALSLVGKKNFYYAAPVYPALVVILGAGLASFRPKAIAVLLGVATVATAWAQFSSRSLPSSTFPSQLSRVDWTGAAGPQKHLFQGIVPLHLGPKGPTSHNTAISILRERVTEDSCACPNHTVFVGQGDASDLHLSLAVTDPCMAVSTWPQLDHPDSVGWVVVESPGCTRSIPPSLRRFDFSMVEARGGGERCVQLYQRGTRGQHRFCGHKGSPPE
ncbi:MAG: hypothetical protein VX944_05990 [Myxococcota bacterium]|nr:hypothetical protein [Myxococcota bacterium]MEC9389609.1 hypothetical protein [Myxococcota bacterium]